jgi:spore germination protein
MTIYVVKRGDTLWLIANQYKVTMSSIIEINQLQNPNQLVVGQAVIIPAPDNIHVVRQGESLWSIAQLYHTTVSAIAQENNITDPNLLRVGQVLRIPKPVIEVNGYLTQVGTAGESIARVTGPYLTYISMFSYQVRADGSVKAQMTILC